MRKTASQPSRPWPIRQALRRLRAGRDYGGAYEPDDARLWLPMRSQNSSGCCAGTSDLQVTQANSDGSAPSGAPYDYWSDSQINVLLTPTSTSAGTYDLLVTAAYDENGMAFSANPADYPSPRSNPGPIEVTQTAAQITRAGSTVSGGQSTSPNIVSVGQQITLNGTVTGLPAGVTITNQTWAIQGSPIASYTQALDYTTIPVTCSATSAPLAATPTGPQVTFYWIDGDTGSNTITYRVTYTALLSDQSQAVAIAYFRPVRPSPVSFSGTTTTTVPAINESNAILQQNGNPVPSLNFGYPDPDYGIQFNSSVSTTYGGNVALLQLVNTSRTITLTNGTHGAEVSGTYVLDDVGALFCQANPGNCVPQYSGIILPYPANKPGAFPLTDTPAVLLQGTTAGSANDQFQTYLMYQPPGNGSIWVTLETLSWSWNGAVSLSNGTWTLSPNNTYTANPNGSNSTTLPLWSGCRTSLTYNPQ